MSNKLEIPRLLAWRLAGLDPDYTTAQLDADEEELRALLAAPVVERQEPVGWVQFGEVDDGEITDYDWEPNRKVLEALNIADNGNGTIHGLWLGPVEQPAPVAVVLPDQKPRISGYWFPLDLNDKIDDTLAKGWNACLDKVKALNQ